MTTNEIRQIILKRHIFTFSNGNKGRTWSNAAISPANIKGQLIDFCNSPAANTELKEESNIKDDKVREKPAITSKDRKEYKEIVLSAFWFQVYEFSEETKNKLFKEYFHHVLKIMENETFRRRKYMIESNINSLQKDLEVLTPFEKKISENLATLSAEATQDIKNLIDTYFMYPELVKNTAFLEEILDTLYPLEA